MLLENLREGDPRHIVTESLAELCPTVMWKAELVNDKIGRLAEETSKQAVESVAWWLLAAYIKCERKERELRLLNCMNIKPKCLYPMCLLLHI